MDLYETGEKALKEGKSFSPQYAIAAVKEHYSILPFLALIAFLLALIGGALLLSGYVFEIKPLMFLSFIPLGLVLIMFVAFLVDLVIYMPLTFISHLWVAKSDFIGYENIDN